jgi:hypothetical protein
VVFTSKGVRTWTCCSLGELDWSADWAVVVVVVVVVAGAVPAAVDWA